MSTTTSKAETVRARRVALGITQRELARTVGCSTSMIAEVEAGVTRSGRVLSAVLDVLERREREAQVTA
jgi:predicted transcriptional regulator